MGLGLGVGFKAQVKVDQNRSTCSFLGIRLAKGLRVAHHPVAAPTQPRLSRFGALLCLDAALDHRVSWTSKHSALLAGWASPRTSLRMPRDGFSASLWFGGSLGSHHCQEHAPRSPSSGRAPVRQECTHARSDASFLHAAIASDLAQ